MATSGFELTSRPRRRSPAVQLRQQQGSVMGFGRMTVKAKLSVAFGCLAAIVLVVSALAVRALGHGHDNYARYVGETGHRLATANDILDATNARAVAARNLVLVTAPGDRDTERTAVTKAHEKVGATVAKLKDAISKADNATDRERTLFSEIETVESRYGPVALNIVDLALADKRDEAIARMNADCRPLLAELIKAANAYIAHGQAGAAAEIDSAGSDYVTSRNLMLGGCALSIALGVVLALTITRGLVSALGAEPAELNAAAQRIAEGELGPVTGADRAPVGSVMAALGHMQARLAEVVSQVRQASDSIATGSAEIANGNADLSQRTEEQASNLQQTAASMEQMNATVKNSAETALQATQLATSASAAAQKGGQVVGEVVSTMNEITQSSRKIADITGVIDGIAFQTNILALNAAVEAARAGEQGRGFAVVASEVRSLAQRSAEAAKEIKSLIGASVERVEAGSRLVGEAGENMENIVSQVKRVADLMAEISSATIEQTSGIGQVSDAVTQLDQATQQNAALVEESAAAADSLKQQASRLAAVVCVFKLDDKATPRHVPPASPPSRAVVQATPRPTTKVKPRSTPVPAAASAGDAWEAF
jgi:methyl-accepting chemotaxis protein-1 (serine sensor receptor)